MKRTFLTFLCAGTLLGGFAQSKIDLYSRLTLQQDLNPNLPRYNPQTRTIEKGKEKPSRTMAMIEFKGQDALEELKANGVDVLRVRADIAIVNMPIADVERVADLKCVRRLELPRNVSQKMDVVREAIGINKIHLGTGLPQAYTGKGVVTGIVDGGVDPNHINFLDKNGRTRYGYMGVIYASNADKKGYVWESYFPRDMLPIVAQTRENMDNVFAIEDYKTDDKAQFHGTHTTGIMAGGYRGKLSMAQKLTETTSHNVEVDNPYYGCATESEIASTTGELRDKFIAFGVDDIINYAYKSGPKPKPCVVNLSLGSNLGSHDSTSIMNRFLSLCAKDAIICVAAGNEADHPVAVTKTFTPKDTLLQTFIRPMQEGKLVQSGKDYFNLRSGTVFVYNSDSTDIEMQIVVYNETRKRIATRITAKATPKGTPTIYASGSEYAQEGAITTNSTFNRAFNGYVQVAATRDPETKRYYAVASFLTSDNQATNKDANYKLGIVVKGKDKKRVDIYGDARFVYFDDYGHDSGEGDKKWEKGSRNGTISDMACAPGTISVGSYNVRYRWPSMDGYLYGFNNGEFPTGKVSRFSSYGTILDGRNLPLVCAPGTVVISSVSTYAAENPAMQYDPKGAGFQASLTTKDRKYYWHQTMGTSMATPVVAGSIALWLEADPTLTSAEVEDIIRKTAVVDNDVREGDPVQWGAGKFDAYAGLKEVLRRKEIKTTGIDNPTADTDNRTVITSAGVRRFNVFRAGEKQLDIRVFTPAGQLAHRSSTKGDETTIDASTWNKGVYLIQVNGKTAKKIIIY